VAKNQQSLNQGQTPFAEDGKGKPKKQVGNAKQAKSVTFTKTRRPGVYTTRTEYDNSGDSPYKPSDEDVHLADEDPKDRLAKEFGEIDADSSLDAGEKRRKKAKASLGSSVAQEVE
jgi:hypothetical protein